MGGLGCLLGRHDGNCIGSYSLVGIGMKQIAVIVLNCVGLGSCLWGVFILSYGLVPDAAWRIIVGLCLIMAGSMLAKTRL